MPETSGGLNISEVINTSWTSIETQLSAAVNTLIPVVVGVGMMALGIYAVMKLFKLAQGAFDKIATK